MNPIKKHLELASGCLKSNRIRLSQGLTLIEILLIVMIFVICSSIFYRLYFINVAHTPLTTAQKTLLTLENAMKFYKLDNGNYPTTEQGIEALVTKPTTKPIPTHWMQYLKTIPVDPSGRPFHYVNPGQYREIKIW